MNKYAARWTVVVHPDALKELKRRPRSDADRIWNVLAEMTVSPFFGDAAKMKGEANAWRRRIGSYRILYETAIAERMIFVFRIARRTSSTY